MDAPKKRVLPDVCVMPIWRFLSTRDLLRFVSNKMSKPLLNEQFTHCVKEVLRHRLPLGIKLAGNRLVVVDCADQTVAVIKRWSAFSYSVTCELVESVSIRLPFSFSTMRGGFDELAWPLSWEWETRPACDPDLIPEFELQDELPWLDYLDLDLSVPVENLFSSLRNLREISVDIRKKNFPQWCLERFFKNQLIIIFSHALPQIISLKLASDYDDTFEYARLEEILPQTSLEELVIPSGRFSHFVRCHCTGFHSVANHVARLNSLAVMGNYAQITNSGPLVLLLWKCRDLSDLSLCLKESVRPYLYAFEGLPRLTRLSLDVVDDRSHSLPEPATGKCPVVASVKDVSMSFPWNHLKESYFASLLPKFPSTQELTLVLRAVRGSRFINVSDILLFTGGTKVLPDLRSLTVMNKHKWSSHRIRLSDLNRVLTNATIPEKIDLSEYGYVYLRGTKSLTQLYQVLKHSLARSLIIRASVNAAAFASMEAFFMKEFGGNAAHLGDFVTAWIAPGVPVPPGPAEFVWAPHRYYAPTDFLICGRKTVGQNDMRVPFSLRIVNNNRN